MCYNQKAAHKLSVKLFVFIQIWKTQTVVQTEPLCTIAISANVTHFCRSCISVNLPLTRCDLYRPKNLEIFWKFFEMFLYLFYVTGAIKLVYMILYCKTQIFFIVAKKYFLTVSNYTITQELPHCIKYTYAFVPHILEVDSCPVA